MSQTLAALARATIVPGDEGCRRPVVTGRGFVQAGNSCSSVMFSSAGRAIKVLVTAGGEGITVPVFMYTYFAVPAPPLSLENGSRVKLKVEACMNLEREGAPARGGLHDCRSFSDWST